MRSPKHAFRLLASSVALAAGSAQAMTEINIAYLKQQIDQGPVLSNILPEPEDSGLKGAELGIKDSNTTGRFLKQKYTLLPFSSDKPTALIEKAKAQYAEGLRFFVVDSDSQTLKQLSDALGPDALLFNAGNSDDSLRKKSVLK